MTDQLMLELWVGNHEHIIHKSTDEILGDINRTKQCLQSLIELNITTAKKCKDIYKDTVKADDDLFCQVYSCTRKRLTIYIQYAYWAKNANDILVNNKPLQKLIDRCDRFARRLQRNTLRHVDWYPLIHESYHIESQVPGTSIDITAITMPYMVQCDVCGTMVTMGTLDKHKLRLDCINQGKINALRKNGYDVAYNDLITKAALCGLIDAELVPKDYVVMVPQWVRDAAEQYTKGNGYAGMEFHEFINRMKDK